MEKVVSLQDIIELRKVLTVMKKEGITDDEAGNIKCLYLLGLDTKKNYECTVCEHRSDYTNKVATCERWVGFEREDAAWLKMVRQSKEL